MILGISEAPETVSFPAMAAAPAGDWPTSILQGSGCGSPLLLHRRRRHQHHHEQRPHPDHPEAARRAQRLAPATSSAACSRKSTHVEGITLYMQPVQDLTVEDRVSRTQYPVQPGRRRMPPSSRCGCRACWTSCARAARAARRGQRPADRRPQGDAGHRPRHRLALRHHSAEHRRHALRRLRPAPGLHHLHAAQPVPRGAGSGAAVPAHSRRPEQDLRPRQQQRPGAAQPGAAQPVRALRDHQHAAGDQPPGPVPGGDPLLQSGARASRWATRSRSSAGAEQQIGIARQHPGQLPGHRRRPSRPRWPTSRC